MKNFEEALIKRLNLQGFNLSGEVITTIAQVHNEVVSQQPDCSEIIVTFVELVNETTDLIDHCVEHKYIDWEDKSIDGVKSMDAVLEKSVSLIKKINDNGNKEGTNSEFSK